MKRILAFIFAVVFASSAFAANKTATMGDQNSSGVYRVTTDDSGTVTFASDTSIVYPYLVKNTAASTYTLDVTTSGASISDFGGVSLSTATIGGQTGYGSTYKLPLCTSSTLGARYKVSTGVKETITVTPSSTADTFAYSISGTGQAAGHGLKNSGTAQAGDGITATCVSSGLWSISNITGTWANVT